MAFYFGRDLETLDNGDIVVNSNGDLSVGTSKNSHLSTMKFLMSTDLDEMVGDPTFGANLGSLHGEVDPGVVASSVAPMVHEALRQQGVFSTEDVRIRAYQIDQDNIVIFVDINGAFLENDGTIDYNPSISLRFLFPYKEAELIALDEND